MPDPTRMLTREHRRDFQIDLGFDLRHGRAHLRAQRPHDALVSVDHELRRKVALTEALGIGSLPFGRTPEGGGVLPTKMVPVGDVETERKKVGISAKFPD